MFDSMSKWTRRHSLTAYSKVWPDDNTDDGSDVNTAEVARLRRQISALKRWTLLCTILICSLAISLAGNLALQYRHHDVVRSSPVPPMPTEQVTFEKSNVFASHSADADAAWNSLIPAGDGLVILDNPAHFDLPHGLTIEGRSGELYNIAAFHQLHCLQRIRDYMWHLKLVVDTNQTEQIRPILLDPQEAHIVDCFDYLRQALMCAGDTTLEWPREENDGRRIAVDGWGVTHQCVDWDALVGYAKSNTYT